jgi:hypothetical protein
MNGRMITNLGWGLETLASLMTGNFEVATSVMPGNGENTLFLESSWIQGMWPKDIAKKEVAKKKKCMVWVAKWILGGPNKHSTRHFGGAY